jgi:3',5'-cyclic AMP phosphodiesterase CpdA
VNKLASKVRGRFCDWYLLDSLDVTNKTPGTLGAEQLDWLERSLKAAPERPALVMVHHNPQPPGFGRVLGLTDTEPFLALLLEHRQVKALFFGHTHVASTREIEGLHLVNLPACAYRFSADQPTGWTSAIVSSAGCVLTLAETSKAHALHAQQIPLTWRS